MTPAGGDIRGCFLGMVGWLVGGGCELMLVVDATKVQKKADKSTCGGIGPTNAQTKSTASFGNFTGILPPGFSDISTGGCRSGAGQQRQADKSTCGGIGPTNAQTKSTASFGNFTGVLPPGFSDISTGGCRSGAGQQRPVNKSCTIYGRLCADQTISSRS
jgi:hypothetical protein